MRQHTHYIIILLATCIALCMIGCSPQVVHDAFAARDALPQDRDPVLAQRLNAEGLAAIENGDLEQAESLFRQAVAADLFNASAHNNLGLVLMQQPGHAYEAAWQFEYAARLAPTSAEARHNLGTLMEHVGRLEDAAQHYAAALAVDPNNLETMGHLARVYIKESRRDAEVRDLLKELAYRGENDWDTWARRWLLKLGDQR